MLLYLFHQTGRRVGTAAGARRAAAGAATACGAAAAVKAKHLRGRGRRRGRRRRGRRRGRRHDVRIGPKMLCRPPRWCPRRRLIRIGPKMLCRPPARPWPRCHLPVQRWAARGGAARPRFHTLQRRAVALGDAHDDASDAGGVQQPRAPMRRRPLVWPRGHLPTAARGSKLPVGLWGEIHPGACAWGERQRRVSASWPASARGWESARHHPRCSGDLLSSCPECAYR